MTRKDYINKLKVVNIPVLGIINITEKQIYQNVRRYYMVKFYIGFPGNCSEAVQCYSKVFHSSISKLIHHDTTPNISGSSSNTILHSEMDIEGSAFIFNDYMGQMNAGDNFSILLEVDSDQKVSDYFDGLKEGAAITTDIGPLELPGELCSMYVHFKDRFGLTWIILHKQAK